MKGGSGLQRGSELPDAGGWPRRRTRGTAVGGGVAGDALMESARVRVSALETVLFERRRGAGILTLNRPERKNALNERMLREVHRVLSEVADDHTLRVLVLTGSGTRAFCPGADAQVMTGEAAGADSEAGADGAADLTEMFHVPVLLHEMPQVTLAAINGAVAGAGLGWACACDLRVAAASAKFNTAFLERALPGDMCLPWTLPRIIGAAAARELSFLPGKFDAARAAELGLVSRVFADDTFQEQVADLVDRLSGSAPLALRGLKMNYVGAERMTLRDYCDVEVMRQRRAQQTQDAREGFASFAEKRPPVFSGC
jgi:2-(1,2-epoxy-1,2-dihydrophenyl)acetyl-CoA isomerase